MKNNINTKWLLLLPLLMSTSFVLGQQIHKDQYEYGYKGKVKLITKMTFYCEGDECDQMEPIEGLAITNLYYYNKEGNLDSTVTKRFMEGQSVSYTTRTKFAGSRKSGWETILQNEMKIMHGTTTWASDKEYTEKVFDAEDKLQYEMRYWLNDDFRLSKIESKIFESGEMVQHNIQQFEFDETQNIKNYTTINQKDGSKVAAQYKYLKRDHMGNPLRLEIAKGGEEGKSIAVLSYTYYD